MVRSPAEALRLGLALAAAALLQGVRHLEGQRVGVIVSGGNVDLARYAALLTS